MKHRNRVIGLKVKVTDLSVGSMLSFEDCFSGMTGKIISFDFTSQLNTRVEFENGMTDWGNCEHLKVVKSKAKKGSK